MNAAESPPEGSPPKSENTRPALTCAICQRHYPPNRLVQTPCVETIYSICPDCRMAGPDAGSPS